MTSPSTHDSELQDFVSSENKIANKFHPETMTINDQGRQSNPVFKAFGYPSKIYYPNIQQYIRSFTEKGAVVLDSFCGSGTTGIAALLEGRKAILVDNSPQAINLTYNTLNPVNLSQVESTYKQLKKDLEQLINGLYRTCAQDGREGYAEVIITSNIYQCPSCNEEIILYGNETGTRSEYKCTHCGELINISRQEIKDRLLARRKPVEVTIKLTDAGAGKKTEKRLVTEEDLAQWEENFQKYEQAYGNHWSPDEQIVYNRCYPRVGGWPGFPIVSTVSDLFPKHNLLALKIMHHYIDTQIADDSIKGFFLFVFTESLFRSSKRLFTTSGIKNVYHVPPLGKEQNVFSVFERKYKTILKAKQFLQDQLLVENLTDHARILKGNAKQLPLEDHSIDYAFIDPPYGGVVPYAELNLFYSAWLKEKEDLDNEVIIPMDYEKKIEYVKSWGSQLEEAFREVYRVLKPGAYFTIVFQSKFHDIWNELRHMMIDRIGFQFVNMLDNQRSTTFHTNHLNDTNPQSAFITYRKPVTGSTEQLSLNALHEDVFAMYPLDHLQTPRTFREVQSKIINLVHNLQLKAIPSDEQIGQWLEHICQQENDLYQRKP